MPGRTCPRGRPAIRPAHVTSSSSVSGATTWSPCAAFASPSPTAARRSANDGMTFPSACNVGAQASALATSMPGRDMKAMPVGGPARVEPEDGHGHDIVAVQREQSMRRAHERDVVEVAAARARVAHDLRDRETIDCVRQRLVESAYKRLALGERFQVNVVRFAVRLNEDPVRAIHGVERSRRHMWTAQAPSSS